MRLSVLCLGVAATMALCVTDAFALIERRVERRFEVPAGGASLKLDTFSGSVHVSEGTSNAIEITVVEQGDVSKETQMDERMRKLDLRMEQKAGEVGITARYSRHLGWTWQAWPPVILTYDVKVPRRCDVAVITHDGGIEIGSLQGRLSLTNEAGPIFTGEIDGEVKAASKSGGIAVTACTGPIEASTRSGNITVGRAGGRTRLTSAGGYIDIKQARGEVVVRGNGSDVRVGFAPPVKAGADIATSGGNIELIMETGSACTLDLHASVFGRVKVRNLAVTATGGGVNRSTLFGTINDGGPVLKVDAGGGHVLVRGLDPIPAVAGAALSKP